jgi:sodium-dependent dicarboxylate transporter 2/3/5
MALYWFTVAIPLPMTAMIPVVLLPVFGVSKVQDTCMAYLKETNIIFIGVYLLAFAVDLSQVYVRFTIRWMELMGCSHYGYMKAFNSVILFALSA